MSGQQFYEEGEAEEILRRALHESNTGSVGRDRLLSMAAELGISPDALQRAEANMAREREAGAAAKQDSLDRAEYRKYRRSRFWNEALSSYVSVNLVLIAIWWFTSRGYFWPFWILAPWGIGLIGDFISSYFSFSEDGYQRWLRKRKRREMRDRVPNEEEIVAFIKEIEELVPGKLEAIKQVRERFGIGLKEAKDVVDDNFHETGST